MADGNYRIDIYLNGGGGKTTKGPSSGSASSGAVSAGLFSGASGSGGTDGIIKSDSDFGILAGTNVSKSYVGAAINRYKQSKGIALMSQNAAKIASGNVMGSDGSSFSGYDLAEMGQINEDAMNITKSAMKKNAKTMNVVNKYAVARTAAYVSNHVGLWTGDNTNQQKVNNAMKLGMAGYAMATGNPALAAVGLGLEAGFHAIDYYYKRSWDSKQEQESARRSGLVRYIGRK